MIANKYTAIKTHIWKEHYSARENERVQQQATLPEMTPMSQISIKMKDKKIITMKSVVMCCIDNQRFADFEKTGLIGLCTEIWNLGCKYGNISVYISCIFNISGEILR